MATRVLIVEDDSYFAGILRDYLEYVGYAVEIASDGQEGLEAWQQSRPDLLLTDVLLPRLNGLELSAQAKADAPSVPVLLMSAVYKDEEEIRANLKQCGADDYLIKPFDLPDLREKLRALTTDKEPEDVQTDPGLQVVGYRPGLTMPKEGTVEGGFLAPLLLSLRAGNHTGVLAIRDGARWKDIVLLNGRPVWADGGDDHDRLGTMLLEHGTINRSEFEAAVTAMKERSIEFGSALTELHLLTATELYAQLRKLVLRRVVAAFAWTYGTWTLGSVFPRQSSSFEVPALRAVLRGLLSHGDRGAMGFRLAPHTAQYAIPTGRFGTDWAELKGDEEASALGPFISGSRTLETLRTLEVMDPSDLDVLIWVLFRAGSIGFADTAHTPAREQPSISMPRITAPDQSLTDIGEQIIRSWLKHWQANYFDIFQLDPSANETTIAAALDTRVLNWDADSLPANLPGDIRQKAKALCAWIEEARATLADPARREAYGSRLYEGLTGLYRRIETADVAQASMFFQLGKGFMQNRDFSEAKRSFSRAVERCPDCAEYVAYLGYAGYRKGGATPSSALDAREHLDQALEHDPHFSMAWFFLGVIARDQKEYRASVESFEKALQYDPGFEPARRSLQQVQLLARGTRGPLNRGS
jgi:DNA-binding response OmpR family regulator